MCIKSSLQLRIVRHIEVYCLFLVLASAVGVQMISLRASEPTTSVIVDNRYLNFYDEMTSRLQEYEKTKDWKLKILPRDLPLLNTDESAISIEVYVLSTQEVTVYFQDGNASVIAYQATDQQVADLSSVPNSHLYKSEFDPVVSMTVNPKDLPRIAEYSFVYCIRIIPKFQLLWLTISQARTYNDISYVMGGSHDSDVDPMDIAILDNGYDVGDSLLNGEAADNIESTWDYVNNDATVNDGLNEHGSTCLDLLARTFGDTGQSDTMYDDPNIYHVLKICHQVNQWDPGTWAGQREAIEWCIVNDMEVVSMSWGGLESAACDGLWCSLFRSGTLLGVTWVAAVGNNNVNWATCYPAECYWVIGVGGYESINAQSQAVRWVDETTGFGSDYGWANYAGCFYCKYFSGKLTEFKPNVYDAAEITDIGEAGTSLATPIAAACIAHGIYSQPGEPTYQYYTPGFQLVHDTIVLCMEWPVVNPPECSQQGDVTDTHTLWHRMLIGP